jgi:hypothetical protein
VLTILFLLNIISDATCSQAPTCFPNGPREMRRSYCIISGGLAPCLLRHGLHLPQELAAVQSLAALSVCLHLFIIEFTVLFGMPNISKICLRTKITTLTLLKYAICGGPNRTTPGELLPAPTLAPVVLSQKPKKTP